MFSKVVRSWGYYVVLLSFKRFKLKFIKFKPYCKLSIQKHRLRSEAWIRLWGSGISYVDGKSLASPRFFYVPRKKIHSFFSWDRSAFIEIQWGIQCIESDIERFN